MHARSHTRTHGRSHTHARTLAHARMHTCMDTCRVLDNPKWFPKEKYCQKKCMGSNCIKVLTQGIMLLCRPPLGNGVLCSPFGVLYHPTGSPSGFLYHPSGYALGMIKKPLGGPLGMIKSPSGGHKTPYPTGGVDIISQYSLVHGAELFTIEHIPHLKPGRRGA